MEKITDIAQAIKKHRDLEINSDTRNNAVARIKTMFKKEEKQFWIINTESHLHIQRDFLGNPITSDIQRLNIPYKDDGLPVFKNSKLGGNLLSKTEGQIVIDSPTGIQEFTVHNRAVYDPISDGFAKELIINLANDSKTHTFLLLADILALEKDIEAEKEKLLEAERQDNDLQVKLLIESIENKEAERETKLAEVKSFIRKVAELRYQPILDTVQEDVKRSKILNGNLIINGGPGTGKTTSLIQRIKFLTSQTITDYVNLTTKKKDVLFNQSLSWIFFTPNELLSLFLRNSMTKEELLANDSTIKVWTNYRNNLFQTYKLTDSQTRRPFLNYNNIRNITLLPTGYSKLKKFIDNFNKYFIKVQTDKLEKIRSLDLSPFEWKLSALPIQKDIESADISSLKDVLRFYLNLQENYSSNALEMNQSYNELIKKLAGDLLLKVKRDEEKYKIIIEFLAVENVDLGQNDEEEDVDEEIEREDFEEFISLESAENLEFRIFQFIKSLIRKSALKKYESTIRFSTRESKFLALLPVIEHDEYHDKLGQLAFYKKYFERISKGIVSNVYREITSSYKKYRREEFTVKSKNWNLEILEQLVVDQKNLCKRRIIFLKSRIYRKNYP